MAIKFTGVRSLQDKLHRTASDLRLDAERILREHPDRAEISDALAVEAAKLDAIARSC